MGTPSLCFLAGYLIWIATSSRPNFAAPDPAPRHRALSLKFAYVPQPLLHQKVPSRASAFIIGRAEEAIPVIERTLLIDPLSPLSHGAAALVLAHSGRISEAIRETEISVRLNPETVFNRLNLALLLSMDGRSDDALAPLHIAEELEGALKLQNGLLLAPSYAAAGARDRAREIADSIDIETLDAAFHAGYVVQMGDRAGAIDLLTHELTNVGRLPRLTNSALSLLPLHDDPRYKALLAKTGLHI